MELRLKARMGDEDKKPLLNQINYIWVTNLMNKRLDLNPTSIEVLEWIRTGQIDEIRKESKKKLEMVTAAQPESNDKIGIASHW